VSEKILLVEDEADLVRAESAILRFNKYDVDVAYNGEEALNKVKEDNYDVIVMDIMMPVMDGLTALKQMRSIGVNTPIILLTAKAQVDDKVEGLDSGANDYLTKPFDKKELLARIRALIRSKEEVAKKFQVGNVNFNKEDSEIYTDSARLKLNNKECEIMEILIKNQERPVAKAELAGRLWEDEVKEDELIMYMNFLKDKLTALNADISIIENDGYLIEKL
jgi:DNA-binding response OmpR family regulator